MYKIDTAVWEITLSCNISCLHCGSSADIHQRPSELTTPEALDLIEQLAQLKCGRVVLSGGEPFMRKDWPALVQRIRELGMVCSFISNGFAVTEDTIDLMQASGMNYIAFSLDGADAKTHDYIRGKEGVFEHLMWVFDRLAERGIGTSAVSTIHKGNIDQLEGIRDVLIEHGVSVWQIQTANVRGRMPKDWALEDVDFYAIAKFVADNRKRYKDIITITEADNIGYFSKLTPSMGIKKWGGCAAGMSNLRILSDGSIKGCLSLIDDSYIEGNIRARSLKDIWTDPECFKYNRRFDMKDLGGICAECKYGAVCRGGCCEKCLSHTGKLHNSPYCLYDMEKRGKIKELYT